MKKKIIIALSAWLFSSISVFAHIDVVYPKSKNVTVNTSSIFFVGNTTTGAKFSINSQPVDLWENNFFVHVIPLKHGKNQVKMVSSKNGRREVKYYTVYRTGAQSASTGNSSIFNNKYQPKNQNYSVYSKTISDNAPVRENPTKNAIRVTELPSNVVLYLAGKQGDYYKIEETGKTQYWIHKSNIQEPVTVSKRIPARIKSVKTASDNNYRYVKFSLNYPVLYTLNQTSNNVEITLLGVETRDENGSIKQNYTYNYTSKRPLIGYDAYYKDNTLIFRSAKIPKIKDRNKPLKDITIFVDAGHGGSEKGSVGPSRVNEKNINLAISNFLAKYLQEEGANVVVSRSDDVKVDLYERVKKAKDNNALISVSIHNNSLPNGKNPYVQHGTEVHYYNENAKLLAEIIQDDLVQKLNFKDNGVHKSSFALNRSTNPVSVLVECAYMINPEEYMRLKNVVIQKQIAKSIKGSLKKYILAIQSERL